MTLSLPSPEVQALFISDEQFRDDSGIAVNDPLLDPGGKRFGSAFAALGAGVGAGLVGALVHIPSLRWPAGIGVIALILTKVALLAELGEAAMITALAAAAALAWFCWGIAGAGTQALAVPLAVAVLFACGFFALTRYLRRRQRERDGYDVLARLRTAIGRYNALVRALDVKERLARARGAKLDSEEDAPVLAAIRTTRENLVRAVRVQRVLRENRDVVLDADALRFEELIPVDALRIQDTAETYAELATETLQVAAEVQQAYDELCDDMRPRSREPGARL